MYLIHVRLSSFSGAEFPCAAVPLFAALAEESDRLEHVSVHRGEIGSATVGIFFAASSLSAAEGSAQRICCKALRHPSLRALGFTVAASGGVLHPEPWWNMGSEE
jgi:hypothetical protein